MLMTTKIILLKNILLELFQLGGKISVKTEKDKLEAPNQLLYANSTSLYPSLAILM